MCYIIICVPHVQWSLSFLVLMNCETIMSYYYLLLFKGLKSIPLDTEQI